MTLLNVAPYLAWPAQFCLFSTLATYVISILSSNVSQVDRLWTFLPTIYSAYYAFLPIFPNSPRFWLFPYAPKELGFASVQDFSPRALLMFFLTVIWMYRLSYNTWRRGLFNLKDEDYRWAILRGKLSPFQFQVFNFVFIAAMQNILLLIMGLPTYVASVEQTHSRLQVSDYVLAASALLVIAGEFVADNQQYAYHAFKREYIGKSTGAGFYQIYQPLLHCWPGARLAWNEKDGERGFNTRGLWAYSRHPNFACEQSFWWIITLFPLLSQDFPLLQTVREVIRETALTQLWYLMPGMLYSLLFISSTTFSESISSSKYPLYKNYKRRVSMFLPIGTLTYKKWVLALTKDLAVVNHDIYNSSGSSTKAKTQ